MSSTVEIQVRGPFDPAELARRLGQAFQQSPQRGYVDMATELRHVMSKPLFTADECNARGIPRPGGVA